MVFAGKARSKSGANRVDVGAPGPRFQVLAKLDPGQDIIEVG